MTIKFEDIVSGFDYVSAGAMGENEAYLNKETGKVVWHSDSYDNFEELPDDIEDEKTIEIPHKIELDLGKNLAIDFAYEKLPDEFETVKSIFSHRGAYPQFKILLDNKDMLEQWYAFEAQAQDKALREWCVENELEVID